MLNVIFILIKLHANFAKQLGPNEIHDATVVFSLNSLA